MPHIIDSLVVLLGIDPSGFNEGRKRAEQDFNKTKEKSEAVAKDMQAQGKKAGEFFGQIKNQLIGLFAVFTAGKGVQDFVRSITVADAGVGRLSKTIGASVEEITKWQGAAKAFSGDANGVVNSYAGIVQQFEQFQLTGDAAVIPYFRTLGVELVDAGGKLKSMTQLYTELAAAIERKKIAAPQAMALLRGAGIDDNTARLLIQGTGALKEYLAAAEKAGHTTKADADAAQKVQQAFSLMSDSFRRTGETLQTSVTPMLVTLMEWLQKIGLWFQQHQGALRGAFIGMAAGVAVLAVVLAPMTALFAGIAVAIAGLGAAIGYLYEDWSKWNSGAASEFGDFWNSVAQTWSNVVNVAMAAFNAVSGVWDDGWRRFGQIVKAVETAVIGSFNAIKSIATDAVALIVAVFTGSADDIRAAWAKLGGDLGKVWDAGWERGGQLVEWLGQQFGRLGGVIGDSARRGWTAFADFAKATFNAVVDYIEGRIKVLLDLFPSIGKAAEKVGNIASSAYDKAKNAASGVVSGVGKFFSGGNKFGGATYGGQRFGGQTFGQSAEKGPQIAGARAGGGPVEVGKSYLVGERGAEVVSFGASGTVIPNGGRPAAAGPSGGTNPAGIIEMTHALAEAVATFGETATRFGSVLADQAEYLGISERGLRTAVEDLNTRITRNLVPGLSRLSTVLEDVVDLFGDGEDRKRRDSGEGEGGESGDARGGERSTAALPAKEQQKRIEEDVEKLQAMGWTREQAIGIAANLQAESGMNEKAVGDNGHAYGLAQWQEPRQAEFRKWAGKNIREATHDEQLAFVDYELRHGNDAGARRAGRDLAKATDSATAAAIVSKQYERPRAVEEAASTRAALARLLSAKAPPTVLNITQGAPATAVQSPANDNRQTTTNNTTHNVTTSIGAINTQATDAQGIARDIGPALQRFDTAGDANYGIA